MKPLCSAARANLLARESELAMPQNNDYLGAEQMDYGALRTNPVDSTQQAHDARVH
jgi:hypothetical protein